MYNNSEFTCVPYDLKQNLDFVITEPFNFRDFNIEEKEFHKKFSSRHNGITIKVDFIKNPIMFDSIVFYNKTEVIISVIGRTAFRGTHVLILNEHLIGPNKYIIPSDQEKFYTQLVGLDIIIENRKFKTTNISWYSIEMKAFYVIGMYTRPIYTFFCDCFVHIFTLLEKHCVMPLCLDDDIKEPTHDDDDDDDDDFDDNDDDDDVKIPSNNNINKVFDDDNDDDDVDDVQIVLNKNHQKIFHDSSWIYPVKYILQKYSLKHITIDMYSIQMPFAFNKYWTISVTAAIIDNGFKYALKCCSLYIKDWIVIEKYFQQKQMASSSSSLSTIDEQYLLYRIAIRMYIEDFIDEIQLNTIKNHMVHPTKSELQ